MRVRSYKKFMFFVAAEMVYDKLAVYGKCECGFLQASLIVVIAMNGANAVKAK